MPTSKHFSYCHVKVKRGKGDENGSVGHIAQSDKTPRKVDNSRNRSANGKGCDQKPRAADLTREAAEGGSLMKTLRSRASAFVTRGKGKERKRSAKAFETKSASGRNGRGKTVRCSRGAVYLRIGAGGGRKKKEATTKKSCSGHKEKEKKKP